MSDSPKVAVLARRTAARTVAAAFMPTERAAEEAALHGANCIRVMIEQRNAAKLPPHVGIDEIVMVAAGVGKVLEGFRELAHAHRQLIKIPEQNDLDDTFGPTCGPNKAQLRAVDGVDQQVA